MCLICSSAFADAGQQGVSVSKALEIALGALRSDELHVDAFVTLLESSSALPSTGLSSEDAAAVSARLRQRRVWQVDVRPSRIVGSRGWANTVFIDATNGELITRFRQP